MLRKFVLGTAAMSSVRILRLLAQFVAIPILARLLTPAEYGLVALAMPFALFAMMIADAGIGMSLVRVDQSDRTTWSTCFWLTTLLGLTLALIMAALGPVAASVFNAPELTAMLVVLSFVVLAQSIHLIPVAALQQAGRFRTIALNEISSTVVGITTAVYMAYHGYGAWALIGQQVSYFAVRVTSTLILSPFRPARIFAWRDMREHITFGRDVLGANLINYAARSLDSWIIGKVLGTILLGFYSMAFQFARLPTLLVTGPLQFVIYAELARMKETPEAIAHIFLLITRLLAIVILPVMAVVAVAHQPLFALILSSKWQPAAYMVMLLAPAAALQAVTAVGETVAYALGRADIQLRNAAEFALLWLITLAITARFGLNAAAITYTGCFLLYLTRYLGRILPLMQIRLIDYLACFRLPMIASLVAVICYRACILELSLTDLNASLFAAALTTLVLGISLRYEWYPLKREFARYLPAK